MSPHPGRNADDPVSVRDRGECLSVVSLHRQLVRQTSTVGKIKWSVLKLLFRTRRTGLCVTPRGLRGKESRPRDHHLLFTGPDTGPACFVLLPRSVCTLESTTGRWADHTKN